MTKYYGKSIRNAVLAAAAVVVLLAAFFTVFALRAKADLTPLPPDGGSGTTYTINGTVDMVRYSYTYLDGTDHTGDTLIFAISEGNAIDLTGAVTYTPEDSNVQQEGTYQKIGTSEKPFAGVIKLQNSSITEFKTVDALFGYVSTDMRIVDTNGATGNSQLVIERASATPAISKPLLADTVKKGTINDNQIWKIKLKPDDTELTSVVTPDYAGVVSVIEAECRLSIDFEDASNTTYTDSSQQSHSVRAGVSGTGNLGIICGTLGAGAELTVALSGDNYTNGLMVTSTGGHAGTIVGEMQYDGSEGGSGCAKLIFAGSAAVTIPNIEVSTTGGSKYAGGVVGYAENAEIELPSVTAPSGQVGEDPTVTYFDLTVGAKASGSNGAGGIYGYYKSTTGNGTGENASVRTFDLTHIKTNSDLELAGGTNVGGVFGMLEATNSITIDGHLSANDATYPRQMKFSGGTNRGGVIGSYKTNLLSNTLLIQNNVVRILSNNKSAACGGVIGRIDDGVSPAYVKVQDSAVRGNAGGGVIGTMGTKGSFLDAAGQITAHGEYSAGLVVEQKAGVIRISGTTDLSNAKIDDAQIVKTRGDGLIYALGTGTNAGWTLRRRTPQKDIDKDDVLDWGEVLRISSESAYFTVDNTNHTVTVLGPVLTMASVDAFIRTALNIQLNVSAYASGGAAANGALRFTNDAPNSATLLSSSTTLTLSADIDLSGTGIVALMRDNYDSTNTCFRGTFEGGNHSVTLAIGEPYGYVGTTGTTLAAAGDSGSGMIYNHKFIGLIPLTRGATIRDLTLAKKMEGGSEVGNIWVAPNAQANWYIGGVAGYVRGGLTLSNVKAYEKISVDTKSDKPTVDIGGLAGTVGTENEVGITISTTCEFSPTIYEASSTVCNNVNASFGIGSVRSAKAFVTNVSGVTLGGTYSNNSDKAKQVRFGGLIGYIIVKSDSIDARKINLTDITVSDDFSAVQTVTPGTSRGSGAGGFLGYVWNDVEVKIGSAGGSDGVTIGTSAGSGASNRVTGNKNIGGLVYRGSGPWTVNDITVNKASVSGGGTFGFIVNDAIGERSGSALYLDVVTTKSGTNHYNIAGTTVSGSFSVFDEIAAYSNVNETELEANGQAIISIRTADDAALIMTGSACNTYQNQTAYGKVTLKVNPNCRYYYNLSTIEGKSTLTPAEKLLIWSVKQYAIDGLKKYFTNGFESTISGNCDMKGLSYYPVTASGMSIASGTTIKFYNEEIENREAGTGDTDSSVRSTRKSVNESQHRLMHEGIFLNYTGSLTVSGLTVQGNVSNQNDAVSGFIVHGTFGNTATGTSNITLNNIVLDGAYISGRSAGDYAPMLVNRIGKNSNVSTAHVSTSAAGYPGTTTAQASSLIGDVGSVTDTNIRLSFTDIRLDARTTGLLGNTQLNNAYHTTRSIFDRATLLNSFVYLNDGSGEYNYNYSEDWNGTTAVHHVTYGQEVTNSVEYAGREKNYYDYYGASDHFTHPTTPNAGSEYDFSSDFLRYVYLPYTEGNHDTDHQHELRVNVREVNLDRGCGQYNDPYMITDGGMLYTAARIISGVIDEGIQVMLPSDIDANGNASSAHAMWHDSTGETDRLFTYKSGTGGKKFYAGANDEYSYTADQVRKYLAGAYYKIVRTVTETNDGVTTTRDIQIDLPAGFSGLGAVKYKADLTNDWSANDFECPYAFHGVIVGETGAIIVNHSANPLIKNANGCVVRNVAVSVDASVTISQNNSATAFTYAPNSCASYGAVMGQVMGGDNIIDAVSVDFTDAVITVNDRDYTRLVPVGGYVGVVVNGGLIFRNMTASGVSRTGLTNSDFNKINDPGWLYVNPIIGRVLAGYAFTESASYQYAEGSVTMNNSVYATEPNPEDTSETLVTTVKNYVICDFAPASASNKLTVTANGSLFNIGVPDAQALHVLSFVVNSGAGSAGSNGNYAAINGSPWIAYRNYAQIRCADYDEVGSAAVLSGDYATVEAQDKYSGVGSDKIPYVIRTYTADVSGTYNARRICGNGSSAAVSAITFSQGVYNLSAGYRGIGNIYKDDNAFKLRFKSIAGNNATINLNMVYLEYNHQSGFTSGNSDGGSPCTTYTGVIENYRPYSESAQSNVNVGFGLFNVMYHVSEGTNDTISNLTLTGSVFYDIRKMYFIDESYYVVPDGTIPTAYATSPRILYSYGYHNYKSRTGYYRNNADRIDSTYILHTGGLAGLLVGKTVISGVTLDGLTVEGAKYTGGLIGFSKGNEVAISGSSAQGITVIGGFRAGGLIGGFFGNAKFSFTGTRTIPAVINLTNAEVKGYPSCAKQNDKNNATFAGMFHSVGGLCGSLQTGTANSIKSTIEYVDVTGQISAPHADQRPNDLRYKIASGGLFGKLDTSNIDVKNTSVSNLTIEGNLCGGAVGYVHESMVGNFTNISISNIEIESKNSAGGLIGFLHCQSGTLSVNVDRMSVLDCEILSDGIRAQSAAVGGIVGGYTRVGGTGKLDLANVLIKDCEIERHVDGKPTDTPDYKGVGGLFGDITDSNINTTGHNILIDNLAISDTGNYKADPGVLAGTLTSDTSNTFAPATKIRLVGVSVQNCPTNMPMVGNAGASQTPFGTGGYVIMADFNGDSLEAMGYSASTSTPTPTPGPTADPAALEWSLMNTETPAPYDYYPTAPYVVVEPHVVIGTDYSLTGDGMAAAPSQLSINGIVNELDTTNTAVTNTNRYNYAAQYLSLVKSSLGKFSTYNTEIAEQVSNDFAVLIVEDYNKISTTNLINAYINLLANTKDYNYASDLSGVYSVDIYKMEWTNGSFTPTKSTGNEANHQAANLKHTGEQFYIVDGEYDTAGNMFSLIDVKFLDPADSSSSRIAYHLYVPVIVRKMMRYSFEIGALSGTDYLSTGYDDPRWGKALMENLGTPVTMYFKYTYDRDAEEWAAAANNGDDLLTNFNKLLKITTNTADIQDDTLLVLVDRNNGGKPYYAWFNQAKSARTGDVFTLDLSKFRSEIVEYNQTGVYADAELSGEAFSPIALCDLVDMTAREDASGQLVPWVEADTPGQAAPVVSAKLEGVSTKFRRATEEELSDAGAVKYSISVNNAEDWQDVSESYYLSVFTDEPGENEFPIHHYRVETVDLTGTTPARMQNKDATESMFHLIIGRIFMQTFSVSSHQGYIEEMSETNHALNVVLDAVVKFTDASYNEASSYLEDQSIRIYHSFLVNLTKDTGTSAVKKIFGDPACSGSYTITKLDDNTVVRDGSPYPASGIENTGNYIEFRNNEDLKDWIKKPQGVRISATVRIDFYDEVHDDYLDLVDQFPEKGDNDSNDIGVTISANSNMSFDMEKTAFSKSSASGNDITNASYYRREIKTASLNYNPKPAYDGDVDKLGIDPLDDPNGLNYMTIDTVGVYDYKNIRDEVIAGGYDRLYCELRLYTRNDDYTSPLMILPSDPGSYFSMLGLNGDAMPEGFVISAETGYLSDGVVYKFVLDKSKVSIEGTDQLRIPILFTVLTGSAFEARGFTYSNFKVELKVYLYRSSDGEILEQSRAKDYFIYTNAKVLPDFLDISGGQQNGG